MSQTSGEKPADGPPSPLPPPVFAWRAWGVLGLVFAMHALDAADVWLMGAVLEPVRSELGLDELETSWLSTALLLGAAIGGPMVGYLSDRLRRPRVLALAFAGWSLAAVATGLARSSDQIQAARAAAGAGGAATTVIALTLLADLFPRRARGRAFSVLFLAVPAGAVLGRLLAAEVATAAGWQAAFLAVGAPGIPLALFALLIPEPIRGTGEPAPASRVILHNRLGPSSIDYVDLMVNSSFNYAIFGMTAASFAIAGLAYWSPPWLMARGLTASRAEQVAGLILLSAAIAGLTAGGLVADGIAPARSRRLFLVPALAMFAAAAGVLATAYGPNPVAVEVGLLPAEAAMFFVVPIGFTILAGVTMPNMRGAAFGAAIAAGHLLGDLWSPTLMGWVIDTCARDDTLATGLGRVLGVLGAVPVARPGHDPENLVAGWLALLPAPLLAGAVLLAGVRHLPRELALMIAKLRATPASR